MSAPELPNPDEFGMLAPLEQESVKPYAGLDDFILPQSFPELPKISDGVVSRLTDGVRGPTWDRYYPENELLSSGLRHLATLSAFFESAHITVSTPPPEAAPEERPDPYPSRAGWRANFLPPHNPNTEEKADKPAGKIGNFEIIKSSTTFADVGGNQRAKALLQEVAHQFEAPELYEKWDVPVPKGVLLYGEPGTGKTMLAKAFACETGAAFVEIPVAAIRDKYYGEAEKRLKSVFDAAAEYGKPVVLFFDEIDSLLPDRSQLPPSHPDGEIVKTFLQAVDGMQSAKNVMVLGATNYPERLDTAAVRPGRFDQKIEVAPPDKTACQEILAKRLLASERKAKRVLVADELALDEIGTYLDGLTGAHIAEVANRVKRTMAQTERTMGHAATIKELEGAVEFDEQERAQIMITTDDIMAMTLNYRFELAGLPANTKPGDDEPPAAAIV